jgi:hypothetical protein
VTMSVHKTLHSFLWGLHYDFCLKN